MSETSVIKHYKKQLIYRQHDFPVPDEDKIENPKRFDPLLDDQSKKIFYIESTNDATNSSRNKPNFAEATNLKKARKRKKNKNCRGQFRHEAMELIKLGSAAHHIRRSAPSAAPEREAPPVSVIQAVPKPRPYYAHSLPQMVPDRRLHRPSLPPLQPIPRPPVRPIPFPAKPFSQSEPAPKRRRIDAPPIAAIDLTLDHQNKCRCKECCAGEVIVRCPAPSSDRVKINSVQKLPPLFRIDDLLSKRNGSVGNGPGNYSMAKIIGSEVRRQSTDVDAASVSSGGSEERDRDRQIPQGKLFYYKHHNSFKRYFDDTQKKLFLDNINSEQDRILEEGEVIGLPPNAVFSEKDNLAVEEYVSEMTLVEKYIPRDFFLFYKFVTGYQIYNNHLPVSFLTFLKVYNTNGLKALLERYINSLKKH